MASFPRWLDKARATGARLINPDRDASDARRPTKAPSTNGKSAGWRARRELDVDYADIPSFLLPLDLRVRLDKEERKAHSRSRAAPYDKSSQRTGKRNLKLQMPGVLKRLAGPPACPIVIAQYKDEFRGVGHEQDLHWALIVITDPTTLSGPSFQAYAQRRRRRPRRASRAHPDCPPTAAGAETTNAPNETSPSALNTAATRTKTKARSQKSRAAATATASVPAASALAAGSAARAEPEAGPEYDVTWYARHAPASLFDVCATVRTLCLGGVQVGAVRPADVGKLCEYLQSHPPVPRGAGWGARQYVLELLELLRPFKMLRADLQALPCGGVRVEDLLPELREVGRATQESIFNEDFRPCLKVYS